MPSQSPKNFRDNLHNVLSFDVRDGASWLINAEHTKRQDAWLDIPSEYLPPIKSITGLSTDGVAFMILDQDKILWRNGHFFHAPNHWEWSDKMVRLGLPFLAANHMKIEDALMWEVRMPP